MPSTNGHGPKSSVGRVALYLRVSSEEQRDRETIEIQREFLKEYCRLYGLEVMQTYADDGVSGTIPLHERPEGRRLLADTEPGKFETLLVYRLDRLARSLLVTVDAHDRLQEAGVALRSATESIDTSTPSGRLIFQMLASFAEYEREAIRERTRAGVRRAFRDGKPMGVLPYAYRASDDGRLKVSEEEAEIVREIFANIADGSTPYREAKRLNALGVEPPGWRYRNGKWRRKDNEKDGNHGSGRRKRRPALAWSPEAVSNIVRQGAYSGIHEVRFRGEEEPIRREVPAVVSRGLQEQAKAALGENARRREREGDRRYLLAGLVRCAVCGYSCSGHATWTKGKRRSYYTCVANRKGRVPGVERHGAPYLRAEWLENEIWSDVRRFLKDPGEVLERVREQLESESAADELQARVASLTERLAAKQEEKDRYARLYSRGVLDESDDGAFDHLLDLKNQVANLRFMLEAAEAKLAEKSEQAGVAKGIEAWLRALRERLTEMEEETEEAYLVRRQLVRLLVAGITVGRREDGRADVRVTYRFGEPPEDSRFVSGEEYDKAFRVEMPDDQPHVFDSFECAIHALAPTCEHCGVRIIGHGVEANGSVYCCAHCASMAGASAAQDRV